MRQSRELIYKLESLDQLSQATFFRRLSLYLHPCLAVLKEKDKQERLERWLLSLWPDVLFKTQGKRCTGSWKSLVGLHTNSYGRPCAGARQGILNIVMTFVGIRLLWRLLTVPIQTPQWWLLMVTIAQSWYKKHQSWGLGSLWCFSWADRLWEAQKWLSSCPVKSQRNQSSLFWF